MKKSLVLILSIILMMSASCGILNNSENTQDEVDAALNSPAQKDITLYYSDNEATGLYAETRSVCAEDADSALFVVNELLKGSKNKELVNVIPEGTRVNSCVVESGTCTLDLSQEFISKQGTANEQLAIYSVVNTLCAMDDIDEVRFLIDGKTVMIFGSYIFDEPFSADDTIVR